MAKGRIAGTQVIQRASRLLKAFTLLQPRQSLAELAEKVDLPAPTAYRILQALVEEGFLTQDSRTSDYSLGPGLVRLGNLAYRTVGLVQIASPHVQQLASQWGETTNLDVFDSNRQVITILHIPAIYHLATATQLDSPLPPHCTSTGKALLAYLDKPQLEQILSGELERFTSKTITDPAALRDELGRIRSAGYAVNLEELEDDLVAVGAAIRDGRGQVAGAISVGGPMKRIDADRVLEIGRSVTETAASISLDLGYESGPELQDSA